MKGRVKGRVRLSSHALSVQLLFLLSAIVKLGCVRGFSLLPLNNADISRHTQACSLMGGSSICALGARSGVAPCDVVHAGLMGMVMQQRGRGGERGGRGAARGEAGSRGRQSASRGSKGPSWDRADDEERIGSKRPDFARLRRESNRETVNHALNHATTSSVLPWSTTILFDWKPLIDLLRTNDKIKLLPHHLLNYYIYNAQAANARKTGESDWSGKFDAMLRQKKLDLAGVSIEDLESKVYNKVGLYLACGFLVELTRNPLRKRCSVFFLTYLFFSPLPLCFRLSF